MSAPALRVHWYTLMEPTPTGWLLCARPLLFLGGQLVLGLALWLGGTATPLSAAGRWWLVVATMGNLATLALLARARRLDGGLRTLWRLSKATWKGDLAWFLGFTLVAGPVGWLPNVLLAKALWAAPDTGNAVLFRPLPTPVLLSLVVVFPVSQALAELPLYFGQVAPSLRARGWPSWAAVVVPALVLAAQHLAMPLEPEARYLVWRGLMFLPFALLVGLVLARRPTLLPWLMVVHGLMDAQLPVLTWLVATGAMPLST
ncbi:MAG: hypothetical protein SFW67_15870 [Myxococcaceae bacterium]|nr:hypothetical protein [Myxococcaceae bacterium]